jgi:hypothetical protein
VGYNPSKSAESSYDFGWDYPQTYDFWGQPRNIADKDQDVCNGQKWVGQNVTILEHQ